MKINIVGIIIYYIISGLIIGVYGDEIKKMNTYKNNYLTFTYSENLNLIEFSEEEIYLKSRLSNENFISISFFKLTNENKDKYKKIWTNILEYLETEEQKEMYNNKMAKLNYIMIDNIKTVKASVDIDDRKMIFINTFKNEIEFEINLQSDINDIEHFENELKIVIESIKFNECKYIKKIKKVKKELSKIEALSDFDELISKLNIHPNYKEIKNKLNFKIKINEIKNELYKKEVWKQEELFILFSSFVSMFRDGHTSYSLENTNYLELIKKIPLKVKIYNGNIYIEKIEKNLKFNGCKIISIDNILVKEIISNFTKIISSDKDNINWKYYRMQEEFMYLFYFWYGSKDKHKINFINKNNKEEVLFVSSSENIENYANKNDIKFIFNDNSNYTILEINSFEDKNNFKIKIESFFELLKIKKTKNIIIDVRKNNGGDSELSEYVIDYLTTYSEKYIETNYYLLISRATFSSAVSFSGYLKNKFKKLVVIGEETGGIINTYGNSFLTELSNCGLKYRISTDEFNFLEKYKIDEIVEFIKPDFMLEKEINQNSLEKDIVLEKAISLIK